MRLVRCSHEAHAEAILGILNEAILHSTAIYDYRPRTLESMSDWFETRLRHGYPILGLEDEAKNLLGFASYGVFRAWPAYKYTVEHSVYIHKNQRRRGYAGILMEELLREARMQDIHAMIGCIDMKNLASIQLHEQLGFERCGILRQVGYKFGEWLDVGFYQRILDTPAHPRGG